MSRVLKGLNNLEMIGTPTKSITLQNANLLPISRQGNKIPAMVEYLTTPSHWNNDGYSPSHTVSYTLRVNFIAHTKISRCHNIKRVVVYFLCVRAHPLSINWASLAGDCIGLSGGKPTKSYTKQACKIVRPGGFGENANRIWMNRYTRKLSPNTQAQQTFRQPTQKCSLAHVPAVRFSTVAATVFHCWPRRLMAFFVFLHLLCGRFSQEVSELSAVAKTFVSIVPNFLRFIFVHIHT